MQVKSPDEIEITLNKIFDSAAMAVTKAKQKEVNVTLEQVDATLKAIFDSVNKVPTQGKNTPIPEFAELLGT